MTIEKIAQTSQDMGPAVTYAPVIKPNKSPSGNAINVILYITASVLFVAVLSTYFVKDLPGAVLIVKDVAVDALWVILGGYAIGEIFKRIFINKARATEIYQTAKKETQETLDSLTDEERSKRAEYCKEYEDKIYETTRDRILKDANIDDKVYEEKYSTLSAGDIKPSEELSKRQVKALKTIYRLKRIHYNPDFLNMTVSTNVKHSPSDMYDTERADRNNTISSALFAVIGGFFGVTFAGELIFSFSLSILFTAVVKTILIVIMAAFKANFGWNLVMKTEINRLQLQKGEAKNLKRWCNNQQQVKSVQQ